MSSNCPACHKENVENARFCAACGALMPVQHADASDPLIGSVLGGRFRIVGLLGEGGMGRVYTAEQQMGSNVRKVAVKTLLEEFSKDPEIEERFMRECGTVSELEHPNTIRFYDFGRTPTGDLYIAMEMVDGAPLADVIEKDGTLSHERVIKVMRQVCGSLQEAHDKGIVHRDLKPENIILTTRAGETDFAKVLDFGIAKRSDANNAAEEKKLTQQGMVLGTPPYMSPEQFTGKELDGRSDIYSLGVIAYEMLTGKLPFKGNTPWEWATQHMTAQPSPFEQTAPMAAIIPQIMQQAIMRALKKDPDERQSTSLQFCDELVGSGTTAAAAMPTAPPAGSVGVAATQAFPSGEIPAVAGAGTSRPGGTQIGDPFVPPTGASPQPHTPPGGMGAAPVPSSGSPATPIPAPPAYGHNAGGNGGGGGKLGLILGAAALAAVLVVGVVFVMTNNNGDDDETDPDIIDVTPTSATSVKSSGDAPEDDTTSAGAAGGQDPAGTADPPEPPPPPPPPRPTTPPPPPPPPPPPQNGPSACNTAIAAALAGRCAQARAAYGKCSGSRKGIARSNVRRCKKK